MPKVRILQAVGGSDFSWGPGDVVDMSKEDAEKWTDGVRGERVDSREKAAESSRGGGRGEKPERR